MSSPQTLIEAVQYYADPNVCHELMLKVKWPTGTIRCPACNGTKVGNIASRRMLQCKDKDCRKQFSTKVGTIFEDSPLPLQKWFVAVWAVANCKNGISSCELGRALGVRQGTAWFMLHRIREAMRTGSFERLDGEVESDETFIGGKAKNMHAHKRAKRIKGRGASGKSIVQGVLQRGGEARVSVVPRTDDVTLQGTIRKHVKPGSLVYTDALPAYEGLALGYWHRAVDHVTKYVAGRVHTNGLENFWSLLKRAINGTYVSVAPFHLQRYLDEQAFRYNQRKGTDRSRFHEVMSAVVGRRITYRVLTAQDDAGFMGIA